jgi:hypothetical protein
VDLLHLLDLADQANLVLPEGLEVPAVRSIRLLLLDRLRLEYLVVPVDPLLRLLQSVLEDPVGLLLRLLLLDRLRLEYLAILVDL